MTAEIVSLVSYNWGWAYELDHKRGRFIPVNVRVLAQQQKVNKAEVYASSGGVAHGYSSGLVITLI